jgi:hypothetical protein
MRFPWIWIGVLAAVAGLGCGALRDDVARAQVSYEDARHREALIRLEHLDHRIADMDRDLRSQYYYLRGMVSEALDRPDDALHYLALAREETKLGGAGLTSEQLAQLEQAIAELTPNLKGPSAEGSEPDAEGAPPGEGSEADAEGPAPE